MDDLDPATVVITGPSAAGKSTVARMLAQRFERGVHLEGDWFRRSIASGRVDMRPSPDDEAVRQLRLRYELSAGSTEAYRRAGFGVVVEDVIAGPFLEEYVGLLGTPPIQVVVLMPSLAAITRRERSRDASGYAGWTVAQLYQAFDGDTPRIGHWIDSSDMTPDQTVDEIVRTIRGRKPEIP